MYCGVGKISNTVIKNFEKEYNIRVTLNTYSTDEEAYQKIAEGDIIYDLAILPDYQTMRLTGEGLAKEIEVDINKIEKEYQSRANKYSVPFLSGTLGILYDAAKLDKIMWGSFWDTNFLYQTAMTNNMRDAIAIGLLSYNYDINSKNAFEIDKARVKLTSQRRFILAYETFQAKVNIAEGRAAYGAVYSGEAYNAVNSKYKTVQNLKYAIPEEGSRKFVDCIILPENSENTADAEKFMNYLLKPEVQAENTKITGYAPVAVGAKELLPIEMQESAIIFPSPAVLSICRYYDYNKAAYELYVKAWQAVRKK
jgi:spermidine/putrescine transport system substrate-binding protein